MDASRFLTGLLLVPALASACGRPDAAATSRIEVVAAFYPLAEAARRAGGEAVIVHDLTPAGAEPHDLELRPSDFARIAGADLVLYLGGGFQPALEDALRSAGARSLDLLAALDLPADEPDPHVWLDPTLFARVADRIGQELRALAPDARLDESGSGEFRRTLQALDGRFARTLTTCARREFVTTHAAFGYLARRYGLEQIAIAGLAPESEPSPRRLEQITRVARQRGATTIYFETLVSPRVAEAVARAAGAKTAVLDPIEGLTSERRRGGVDYVDIMEQNLRSLAEGLGCSLAT